MNRNGIKSNPPSPSKSTYIVVERARYEYKLERVNLIWNEIEKRQNGALTVLLFTYLFPFLKFLNFNND